MMTKNVFRAELYLTKFSGPPHVTYIVKLGILDQKSAVQNSPLSPSGRVLSSNSERGADNSGPHFSGLELKTLSEGMRILDRTCLV